MYSNIMHTPQYPACSKILYIFQNILHFYAVIGCVVIHSAVSCNAVIYSTQCNDLQCCYSQRSDLQNSDLKCSTTFET